MIIDHYIERQSTGKSLIYRSAELDRQRTTFQYIHVCENKGAAHKRYHLPASTFMSSLAFEAAHPGTTSIVSTDVFV